MTNDIMIEYTDVAYTSKRGRKAIFDAINDDILRDFLEHDMELPCDSCTLALDCETSGKECKAFRNWTTNGKYEADSIQKHMRMPRTE
jgi:hypothetical protein